MDELDLYRDASGWAEQQVRVAADHPGDPTPCDGWDVSTLLDHMLETQRYFIGSAKGEDASPPAPDGPSEHSADPVGDFARNRQAIIDTFSDPGVRERSGMALGIAFGDSLLHGWDLAKATGQDTTMPAGLAEAAYSTIHGAFTDEQRKGTFGPEVAAGADASAQEKLLAYTGRDPTG